MHHVPTVKLPHPFAAHTEQEKNLQMEAALKFRGYDYQFVGGTGAHNGEHGGMILPESLAWLWRA